MDFFDYVVTHISKTDDIVTVPLMDHLLTFLVAFTSNTSVVKSPHVRAKFGDVLYQVFLPPAARHDASSSVSLSVVTNAATLMRTHKAAVRYLAPSLAELYGDVERCGYQEKLYHRCVLSARQTNA